MIIAGVDAGVSTAKAVILENGSPAAEALAPAGAGSTVQAASDALASACWKAGVELSEVERTVVTGMGGHRVGFADRVESESSCLARGIHWRRPQARTVLDVGYQKCLAVSCDGCRPVKFRHNDRCASGSGRFLEMVAEVFQVDVSALGAMSLAAEGAVEIENTCAVFAESEIVTLVHAGRRPEDIVRGVHQALAHRVMTLLMQVDWSDEMCLVGGVARNAGFARELGIALGTTVIVPPQPEFIAALGAALSGVREAEAA